MQNISRETDKFTEYRYEGTGVQEQSTIWETNEGCVGPKISKFEESGYSKSLFWIHFDRLTRSSWTFISDNWLCSRCTILVGKLKPFSRWPLA